MVDVFVDGFCWPNPNGAMGVGIVIGDEIVASQGSPPAPGNSNNRAELLAVLAAIPRAEFYSHEAITFHTDSSYVINGVYSWIDGERRDRKNADLFQKLADALQFLSWEIIKTNESNASNILADKAARDAAMPFLPQRIAASIAKWEASDRTTPLYKFMIGGR